MMQLIINKEVFQITETEHGYNIKSLTTEIKDKSVNHGELNASIYRLMEILGIWGGKLMQNARYPHIIKKVSMYSVGKFVKETEKTFAGYRKSNILALVK